MGGAAGHETIRAHADGHFHSCERECFAWVARVIAAVFCAGGTGYTETSITKASALCGGHNKYRESERFLWGWMEKLARKRAFCMGWAQVTATIVQRERAFCAGSTGYRTVGNSSPFCNKYYSIRIHAADVREETLANWQKHNARFSQNLSINKSNWVYLATNQLRHHLRLYTTEIIELRCGLEA